MHETHAVEIGKDLVDRGLLSQDLLDEALGLIDSGQPFDEFLLEKGRVPEKEFYSSLAKILRLPFVDLVDYRIDPKIVNVISAETVREFTVFPLFKIRDSLTLVMADPTNIPAIDRIREESGCEVDSAVGALSEVLNLIDQYYGAGQSMGTLVENLYRDQERKIPAVNLGVPTFDPDQPVVQLVSLLIEHAVKERASDIHIEPDQDKLRVRIRVDGVLHEVPAPPKKFESSIIARAKILAEMNIAESRIPQDGRFSVVVDQRKMDVRVSTIPTVFGENVVLRLLDTQTLKFDLKELGFSDEDYEKIGKLIQRPYGMILVTGPTGSGKTTTLYTALRRINSPEKNIVTIEDPVEYRLDMIRQIQINPKVGLSFATGLRSIVRQDPDIILVGEIRDLETAQIAIQSALTGHLVFTTLHTNDAAGAAVRLVDMGVEPFLVASSVIGVVAQRLVRLLCPKCKKPDEVSEAIRKPLHLEGIELFKGKGCQACRQTGFRGRMGIFEFLELDEDIRHLIVSKSSSSQIKNKALEKGMTPMMNDGLRKVRLGLTTVNEILRVAQGVEG